MNPFDKNPFNEAYITETVSEENFVRYFSPYLVGDVQQVFLAGNVIVKGTVGCGKSMILRLLEPEIRLAYDKAQQPFPVPAQFRDFLGARINLSKSTLLDITQRLPSSAGDDLKRDFAITFGDFFNYRFLKSILKAVMIAADNPQVFGGIIHREKLDEFAILLASQSCFFGSLEGVIDFDSLAKSIDQRETSYRSWANGNRPFDPAIRASRTAIGEPLSRAAVCLRQSGAMQERAQLLLTIDQIEAFWTDDPQAIGTYFRRELHELLGRRDERVSFRIGTRSYDWNPAELKMRHGRDLEGGRDYMVIDIDQLLRRTEYGKWPFRDYAIEVFRMRVAADFGTDKDIRLSEPKEFFGESPKTVTWLESLVKSPPEDPSKLLQLDDAWPENWRQAIHECYHKRCSALEPMASDFYPKDPMMALLMAAWGLQNGGKGSRAKSRRETGQTPPTISSEAPWTKQWWIKERKPQVFFQIVSRHRQRCLWDGWDNVLALSGSNMLCFVRICREIWSEWHRLYHRRGFDAAAATRDQSLVPRSVQRLAIQNLSREMHGTFAAQPGRPAGDVRMRFADKVARWLGNKLLNDTALSNPGHNGFSLSRSELEAEPELRKLIEEAVGWGDLYERHHTSKSARQTAGDPRRKFYLHPVLSPHYQLPHAHTKEPVYGSVAKLAAFAKESYLLQDPGKNAAEQRAANDDSIRQLDLPFQQDE